MSVTYPLDLTGIAPTNLVQNELHTVNESHFRDYQFIVPNHAPFYVDNFTLTLTVNGMSRILEENVDFNLAMLYLSATRSTGKPVYGAITLNNLGQEGILSLGYQSVGGVYTVDRLYVLQYLVEKAYNPRTTLWDLVVNGPSHFPPTPHYEDYDDFYGQEEVVRALNSIRDVLADPTHIAAHVAIYDFFTKHNEPNRPVFLGPDGKVEKKFLDMATDQEVSSLTNLDKLVTLRQIIQFLRS